MIPSIDLDMLVSHYSRLTTDQQNQMKTACLEILDHTGVRLYLQEALDILLKSGANDD